MAKVGDEVKSVLLDITSFDDYVADVLKFCAHDLAEHNVDLDDALMAGHEVATALTALRFLIYGETE